uniref:Uncharacterized protein n=1 Tax=Glossina austeni TaxID=7395 RepID=A0A1A9UUF7_GLOAU
MTEEGVASGILNPSKDDFANTGLELYYEYFERTKGQLEKFKKQVIMEKQTPAGAIEVFVAIELIAMFGALSLGLGVGLFLKTLNKHFLKKEEEEEDDEEEDDENQPFQLVCVFLL